MAICPLPFSHSLNGSLAFDGMVTRRLDRVVGRKNDLKCCHSPLYPALIAGTAPVLVYSMAQHIISRIERGPPGAFFQFPLFSPHPTTFSSLISFLCSRAVHAS